MSLLGSLVMLVVVMWWWFAPVRVTAQDVGPDLESQSPMALDELLQDYGYRAFVGPKTGAPYDGVVPENLTGVKVAVMRLRSSSLRSRGVAMYKEFEIPTGVVVRPYAVRLVLVYQNLGNWSSVYYTLTGYTYLSPVLGLLAYDASDLSAKNPPKLEIEIPGGSPILINFSRILQVVPLGTTPKCVRFDLNGSVNLSSLVSGNLCSTTQSGHFSIVVESIAPAARSPTKRVGRIVGFVLGGSALLVVVAVFVLWARKGKQRSDLHRMERASDVGEALHIAPVGDTRAPSATVTRTQPTLEHDDVP